MRIIKRDIIHDTWGQQQYAMESTGGGDVRGVGIEKLYLLIIVKVAIDNELRALWSGRQFLLGASLGCCGALSLLLRWLLILLVVIVVLSLSSSFPRATPPCLSPARLPCPLPVLLLFPVAAFFPLLAPALVFPLSDLSFLFFTTHSPALRQASPHKQPVASVIA